MKSSEELISPDYDIFRCLREDKYFDNRTRKDMLIIYPNGEMTIAMSKLKFHDNIVKAENDEITIEIDGRVVPSMVSNYVDNMNMAINKQMTEMTFGCPELIERYYYGIDGQHKGEYREIPTAGHPVVIKSSMAFIIVLYDDKVSIERAIRDITTAGGPKKYANSLLSDEFHDMGVGIRYINFSPFDLYYASHDNRQVSLLRHMRREEAIRYIQKSRDWTLIDNFTAELEEGNFIILGIIENGKLRLHKFEREENCSLASRSLQFADASRYQEIIPIFYRRYDAEIFLEDYDANVSNVYLDAAAIASQKRIDSAVQQEVTVSKKNMTAVAKVCAAMVTTGLAYGVGRTIIEKIVEGKAKKDAVTSIIMRNNIGNMIRKGMIVKYGTSNLIGKMALASGIKTIGVSSAFATPLSVGAVAAGSVLTCVGAAVVIGGVVIGAAVLVYKNRDKISEFIEEHPVLDKVVTGVKLATIAVLGIGFLAIGAIKKTVEVVCEKIKGFFDWVGNIFGIC